MKLFTMYAQSTYDVKQPPNLKPIYPLGAKICVTKLGQTDKVIPIHHLFVEWGYNLEQKIPVCFQSANENIHGLCTNFKTEFLQ